MRLRHLSAASAAVLLTVSLAGCGGGDGGGSSDEASDPPETSTSTSEPTTPETTPEPKPLTEAELKAALVTVGEIGKPWFEPESVNTVSSGKAGGWCPGKPTPAFAKQNDIVVKRSLTKGQEPGADIATFSLVTLKPAAIEGWAAGQEAEMKRCRSHEASDGTFVQLTFPVDTGGAGSSLDEVIGLVTQIYSDQQHTDLLYMRQAYYGRIGSTQVGMSRAFLTTKSDPQGKDLSEAQQLFQLQVDNLLEQTG